MLRIPFTIFACLKGVMLQLNHLLVICVLSSFLSGNVLGIDFGSNFVSFGILKPGSPITVVRNENEERITPSLVEEDKLELAAAIL